MEDYPHFTVNSETFTELPNIPCSIHSPEVFTRELNPQPANSFFIFQANIRSIRQNFDHFSVLLARLGISPTIVILTETWLSDGGDIFNIDGYNKHCVYRNNHGGGITIFYLASLKCYMIDTLTYINDLCERVTVDIYLNSINFRLSAVYRPPYNDIDSFNDFFFDNILENQDISKRHIICGDLNVNLFNPRKLRSIKDFYCGMLGIGFCPAITRPTKINPENPITKFSLIDQIWCNVIPGHNPRAGVIEYNLTDHMPTYLTFCLETPLMPREIRFRAFTNNQINNFVNLVSGINLDNLDNCSPSEAMELLNGRLLNSYNQAFPIKTKMVTSKRSNKPWITTELKLLITKKYKLLKLYHRGIISRHSFTLYRNLLNYVIKNSKVVYYQRRIHEANDSKGMWRVLNGLMGRSQSRPLVNIKKNNKNLNNQEAADEFNSHFSTVAANLVRTLPANDEPFPVNIQSPPASCFFHCVSDAELRRIMQTTKSKRGPINEVQPNMLLRIIHIILPTLVTIFNNCFRLGHYPEMLKRARVIPIFKQGDHSSVINYRPISTLSFFNKVLEKAIHARLTNYFDITGALSKCQYGFRKKSNTTLAIVNLISHLLATFRNKTYTICMFLDLKKAFDTVDIELLLDKLERYGVRGPCLKLLKSYLTNRVQYVEYNSKISHERYMTAGVPQGSVLGPLLFNIFVNDIVKAFPQVKTILFADDTVFCIDGNSLEEAVDNTNRFIADLTKWLISNKLVAHPNKTKLMLFTSRQTNEVPVIKFFNDNLEFVSNIKYLGITLDNKLSFSNHIDTVLTKLNKAKGIIRNVSHILPRNTLKTIYFSLVYPHLISSIIVWGGASLNKLKPIITCQNSILRIILRVKYDINRRPLMSNNNLYLTLRLLKFQDVYHFFLLKFVNFAKFEDEDTFNIFFSPLVPRRAVTTRGTRLNLPAVRLEVERRATIFSCAKFYNKLPLELTYQMSPFVLKKRYQSMILNKYSQQT